MPLLFSYHLYHCDGFVFFDTFLFKINKGAFYFLFAIFALSLRVLFVGSERVGPFAYISEIGFDFSALLPPFLIIFAPPECFPFDRV
jgi:hypothetical protein